MASFKANMMIQALNRLNVDQWNKETYMKRMKIGPSIKPPLKMKKKYHIREVYKDCYEVNPKILKNQSIMIYFHGGAYVGGLTKAQWKFACDNASLNNCKVYVIDYLLTPTFNYKDTHKHALDIYHYIIQSNPSNEFVFIGDSAGGGLAISLCLSLNQTTLEKPKSIIALCPWLDLTQSYSEQPTDLVLNKDFLKYYAQMYSNQDPMNPLVSPMMINPQLLPPIHLLSCTGDMLNYEANKFIDKAVINGVDVDYYEQFGMFHTYFLFSLVEAKPVFDWIRKIVS